MSGKVKLTYACTDIPAKSFFLMINPQATFEEFLKIISERRKKTYISVFLDYSQIDECEVIQDFLEDGSESIFFVSTTDDCPTSDFVQNVLNIKKKMASKVHVSENNSSRNEEKAKSPPKNQESIPQKNIKIMPKYDGTKLNLTFYFTGSSIEHLLKGIKVELYTSMTPNLCISELSQVLEDNDVKIKRKENLLLYLPGGIPFFAGTLGEVFLNQQITPKKVIYGVLIGNIPERVLNQSYFELCRLDDSVLKGLISPFCNSTDRGLSDMACLLGYLKHSGSKSDLLHKTSSIVLHFPPFITSMAKIINNSSVVGRDIATVCSTFFTFFRGNLPSSIKDDNVFEYALKICNLIANIEKVPKTLPLLEVKDKSSNETVKFLSNLNVRGFVYLWKNDLTLSEDFLTVDFDLTKRFDSIQNSYNEIKTFTPIAPLSIPYQSGCSIVKGKNYEYLYLMQSPMKRFKNRTMIDLIDPINGKIIRDEVEAFAKEQDDDKKNDTNHLIDPDSIKEIIMVNFDESYSMIGDISGYIIDKNSSKNHRVTIAYQYLTILASRIYGYHLPYVLGLTSFNNEVNLLCPLTPLVSKFENSLKRIKPSSTTRLWDSLEFSCHEIITFRKDERGKEKYKNAKSRILVVSDGEDSNSITEVESLVKELLENEIIVDCVFINDEDENKMLCAVCHITGGYSIKIDDIDDGISLFQSKSFLSIDERIMYSEPIIDGDKSTIPSKIKPKTITKEFLNKAKENANFDTDIPAKSFDTIQNFATPRHIIAINTNESGLNNRTKRILKEVYYAYQVTDKNDDNYDPELKILLNESNIEKWCVFIKSPKESLYGEKWWYLHVTFPELYPNEPPIFNFISVPHHLNVSKDGRICHPILEKGYLQCQHVVEIIQQLKELFFLPSQETPIEYHIYIKYMDCKAQYERNAGQLAKTSAKNDFNEFLDSTPIVDDVPSNFSINNYFRSVPPWNFSPISGKLILRENRIMSSTGIYYDRNELRQYVALTRPACVITGKYLDEYPKDFNSDDNDDDYI